jgi:hypothetical protein
MLKELDWWFSLLKFKPLAKRGSQHMMLFSKVTDHNFMVLEEGCNLSIVTFIIQAPRTPFHRHTREQNEAVWWLRSRGPLCNLMLLSCMALKGSYGCLNDKRFKLSCSLLPKPGGFKEPLHSNFEQYKTSMFLAKLTITKYITNG